MTEWVKREHSEGRHILYIEWDAIEQLQREVDALKAPAAPTPVEDEVTREMCEAGYEAWKEADDDLVGSMAAAYRAMRAARPRKGKAQKPVVDREWLANFLATAFFKPYGGHKQGVWGTEEQLRDWLATADAAIAALGAAEGKGR